MINLKVLGKSMIQYVLVSAILLVASIILSITIPLIAMSYAIWVILLAPKAIYEINMEKLEGGEKDKKESG